MNGQNQLTQANTEISTAQPSALSQPTRPFISPPVMKGNQQEPVPNKTGLPDNVLQKMNKSFNADFSNVRVFPNSSKATHLEARAFTQGHHLHFAPGEFNPHSGDGQKILAHELTHVEQQRSGRVKANTRVKGHAVNDEAALEGEAHSKGGV